MNFSERCCLLICSASLATTISLSWLTSFQGISSTSRYSDSSNNELNPTIYDFIIVGGGTSGSVIAKRLSENVNWKILLMEAGEAASWLNNIPVLATYFQFTDHNWGYKTEPQINACLGMTNNRCSWPRGKALGGSSILNYMIHNRGHKLDYDYWAAMGNEGWTYDEVLPYFKKSERFNIPELYDSKWHGQEGDLCVEYVPYKTELATAYLEAGKKMGYKIIDYNAEDTIGFSYIQVNMDKGRRCSAAKAYLTSAKSNLDIITGARVTKLLIDETATAYGVKYIKNGIWYEVYCSREVILSAGTIDSAKLLMLSGVGPKDHLEELGITVIKDLKVGYNLREHIGFEGLTFRVNQSVALIQRRFINPIILWNYFVNNKGPLTVAAGAEALAFVRTKYAVDERPDLELLFTGGSLNSDDGLGVKKAQGIKDEIYNTVWKPLQSLDTWSIWPIALHPRSVGRLKLASKDPFAAPIMDPNFFDDPLDLEIILEGIKLAINISQSEPFKTYGTSIHETKIPGCESFEFGTDDYWRCAIKHLPISMSHQLGTVKMGPSSDPLAVVDNKLKVYGLQNVRVADASIIPVVPSAHINAAVTMIAEKLTDMMNKEVERLESA